jgi:ubiquinone/menaquinone biosynthesis C-methylase UbiE
VSPSGSIAFDRAVADYDRTRALPPGAMRKVVSLLTAELGEHQPCLEIGVGTGRLALPLAGAGIRMVGLDLSMPMLRRLVEKAGGTPPFPVATGDAIALPFRARSFGAAMASHVLHLIPGWQAALAEFARVVRPGGTLLIDLGGIGAGWWKEIQAAFCREAGIARWCVGTDSREEVIACLGALGARYRKLPEVSVSKTTTMADRLVHLADGVFSFTWSVDERTRRDAAERVGRWAKERFGSLTRPRRTRGTISWLAFDLP